MKHQCSSLNCNNEANMKCPTCFKLNLKPSYFCSQICFKSDWKTHKALHSPTTSFYDPFPKYQYTGSLRALYPLSEFRSVPLSIQKPDYAETGEPTSELKKKCSLDISILSAEEIEKSRKVCQLAREVLDIACSSVRIGITTDEIDRIVHEAAIARNCYPSPLNYYGFPKSCCTSVNEVICHGIPDQRSLCDGDILNIDITLYHNGFHGDLNETVFVGTQNEKSIHLVKTTYECLKKAIEICKPGTMYRQIGDVIQKHASLNNLSVVRTFCGHGINQLFHASPNIPHYAKNKTVGVMKPGHVFTIEPMINEGTFHDDLWPDDWTAVTKDGKRSAQFEHQLLITEEGCEVLTENTNKIPWFLSQLEENKE